MLDHITFIETQKAKTVVKCNNVIVHEKRLQKLSYRFVFTKFHFEMVH